MTKTRQDAWLHENDELLAETVIRHVKEGSTQLNAFEEVSDILSRTSAACGFRWNAVVRKQYEEQLAEAKQQRKERVRMLGNAKRRHATAYFAMEGNESAAQIPLSALSLDIVIAYLLHISQGQTHDLELTKWRRIAQAQMEKVEQLKREVEALKAENATIKVDYEQFVQIMNRARKLVVLDEKQDSETPAFKMERNGNLVPVSNQFADDMTT